MNSRMTFLRAAAAVALLTTAGASQASLTVYTSLGSFVAAATALATDDFASLSVSVSTPSPLIRAAGVYTYRADVATTSFYGAGTLANPALSTNTSTDSITFTTPPGATSFQAFGGNFYGTNINGAFLAGDVKLVATDSLGIVSTQTITGATTASFLGFITNGASISSVVLSSILPVSQIAIWPTVDNLTLGQRATGVVPEPGTVAMLLAGLGFVGFAARRRRG